MSTKPETLFIVPARGGSRTVRRKNMRLVGGVPLIANAVLRACKAAYSVGDSLVVVSSDDPTIRSTAVAAASEHGYTISLVDRQSVNENETISDVVAHVVDELDVDVNEIVVVQPTSPTFNHGAIAASIVEWRRSGASCAVTVEPSTSLTWIQRDWDVTQVYDRANRQTLDPSIWVENGALLMSTTKQLEGGPMIDNDAHLISVGHHPDVNTSDDLAAARVHMDRKTITFVVDASKEIGSGHIWRCLALCDELDTHHINWVWDFVPVERDTTWINQLVESYGGFGDHVTVEYRDMTETIFEFSDVVVFDKLDTTMVEIIEAKQFGCPVVCLEDLGEGTQYADITINSMYSDGAGMNVVAGPRWEVLRPEFTIPAVYTPYSKDKNVLVSFGGTDPKRLNTEIAGTLTDPMNMGSTLDITVAAGVGVIKPDCVDLWPNVDWTVNGSMVDMLRTTSLLVTSKGRTVLEAAALGIPTISIPVNEREAQHVPIPGVVYLDRWVTLDHVGEVVRQLLADPTERRLMSEMACKFVDGLGARRVAQTIVEVAR